MARIFVTGGSGFIGREVVRALVAAGTRVTAVARSASSRALLEGLGAEPLEGDLLVPGTWQDAAREADGVIHLAQPETYGAKVTRARAAAYRDRRLAMDEQLLGPLTKSGTRVVYVSGTSYYGDLGRDLVDESVTPRPRGWGPYIAPAIDAIARRLDAGLQATLAFPGWVYGNASWFREYVLAPLRAGRTLTAIGGPPRTASPVHVRDCARALVHLVDRGTVGSRYFLVDDRPAPMRELSERAATAMGVPLRIRNAPRFVARMVLGPIVVDSLQCDAALSNARLKALGFTFDHPTIDRGVPAVVDEYLREKRDPRATGRGA